LNEAGIQAMKFKLSNLGRKTPTAAQTTKKKLDLKESLEN